MLTTALVEFHKHQCYFMCAVEIAAIILSNGLTSNLSSYSSMVMIPLSLNGCVPVGFTFLAVARYGNLTWHLIVLTTLTLTLSSTSLLYATVFTWPAVKRNLKPNYGANSPDIPGATMICGDQATKINVIDNSVIIPSIIGIIWVVSVLCCLSCIIWHALHRRTFAVTRERLRNHWTIRWFQSRSENIKHKQLLSGMLCVILISVWALCFAYLFYLYDHFRRHGFVSTEWTFGQIVAISIWAPSIVEFLYMEGRKLIE